MSDPLSENPEEQAERILERMSAEIAERRSLEQAPPARGRKRSQQQELLRENQEILLGILEEAIAHPLLSEAFAKAGLKAGDLREVAARGDWGSELAPAFEVIGNPRGRHAEDQPAGLNRITAADGLESEGSERQIASLAAASAEPGDGIAAKDAGAGLWSRLRSLAERRRADNEPHNQPADPAEDLPEALRRRYGVHVSEDRKTIQLFENGMSTPAITLDDRAISTPHNNGAVIADVVLLARDRGWQSLKVSGTAEFKDAVWLEAAKQGLSVGHDASPAARAAFEKWDRERPNNEVQEAGPPSGQGPSRRQGAELAAAFMQKSAEERLADPRLRNAQLELMVGIRTAEKELRKPIAEMPDVALALTAAVREQLVQGKVFDAPFVKPSQPRASTKPVLNPRIEADRIPPPRQ